MPHFCGQVSRTCQNKLFLFKVDDADGFGVKGHNTTCTAELADGEESVTVEVREEVGDPGLSKKGW